MPPYQRTTTTTSATRPIKKVAKRDPIYIDGRPPRPMYVDYKDLDLLDEAHQPPRPHRQPPQDRLPRRQPARGRPGDQAGPLHGAAAVRGRLSESRCRDVEMSRCQKLSGSRHLDISTSRLSPCPLPSTPPGSSSSPTPTWPGSCTSRRSSATWKRPSTSCCGAWASACTRKSTATSITFPARGRVVRVSFAGPLRGRARHRRHGPPRRHQERDVRLRSSRSTAATWRPAR